MDQMPVINNAAGAPLSTEDKVLETAASSATQSFHPLRQVCAHLNAFHAYADDPSRYVETNHYCSHVNEGQFEDFRQCILFDGPGANARIIGIEYMITPKLYNTLDEDERKLWHSHVFEVKSGMLIMPAPWGVPNAVWQAAETKEMEKVVELYGKVYHLWQVDRGDKLPLGPPRLMTSYTSADQLNFGQLLKERDERFGADSQEKADARKYINEPKIHPDADQAWKTPEMFKKTND